MSTYLRVTLFFVKQNLTLALPTDTIRRLKVLAAERGTSISRLLTETLEEILNRDSGYDRARARSQAALEHGWELGTGGRARWQRDELHER